VRGRESSAEVRQADQTPEHGRHADQGSTVAQARARYLRESGAAIAAALIGSVTRPAEIRTRAGAHFLVFAVVPDGDRPADEAPTTVRVEFHGDVDALAARLVKGVQIYAEGRLSLSTWTSRDGVERSGLTVKASYIEVLG
jgi:hypothetical protein